MTEAIIPAESSLVGRTVRDSRIRTDSGLTVIGLRRASEAFEGDLLDEEFHVGDTILLTGFWKNILGASPYPFAMVVMLAASSAFMTPVSSPVNTLVVSPGNYRFGDFVKIGVPFTIIVIRLVK